MSSPNPAFKPISTMEDAVANVARWGHVLRNLGAGATFVDPGALWVIGHSLEQLGEDIQAKWEEAFRIAGGRS